MAVVLALSGCVGGDHGSSGGGGKTIALLDTVVKDGFYKPSEICTRKYKAACAKAGVD